MLENKSSTISSVLSDALAPLGGGGTGDQVASLTQQLVQLQTISQAGIESTQANTKAIETSTVAQGSSGGSGSVADTVGTVLQGVLGAGLGLSPLITGLLSLFGGGGSSSQSPDPLTKFALPDALNLSAGVSDTAPGQAFGVDNAQGGAPRPISTEAAAPAVAPAQITVQVQAMDSQSFLDHSNDIALAVRRAMLEATVLNDVIREV
jgi:hypothetical protein